MTAFVIMVLDIAFAYHAGFVLAALYAVLLPDAVADILTLPFVIKSRKEKRNHNRMQMIVSGVCVAIFLVFGTFNMQTVTANRFTYTSEKLSNEYKVVFISDLHVGSSQSIHTTESTIRKIDEENADCVLLGGDIVDEYTTKEEMEETFSLLGEINAPVYFIYGNHDRQPTGDMIGGRTFTDEELEDAILSSGITILKDEWVSFSDDLVIFGRESYNCDDREDISTISPRPDNAFVLMADHSPFETDDTAASSADLQLSGHTHAGQLFPMRWFIAMTGDVYGFYRCSSTDVYVSSGACGWRFPIRTETGCHYEVVTLQPAE